MNLAFGVFHVQSLAAAYQLANSVSHFPGAKLLELIPAHAGAYCLAEGPISQLEALLRDQRTSDLVNADIMLSLDEAVLKAFYSLEIAKLGQSLYVVESSRLGALFKVAQAAVEIGMGILEFRAPRAGQLSGVLTVTQVMSDGESESKAELWLRNNRAMSAVRVEKIEPIQASLRELFED